jgi:hypothetical protein
MAPSQPRKPSVYLAVQDAPGAYAYFLRIQTDELRYFEPGLLNEWGDIEYLPIDTHDSYFFKLRARDAADRLVRLLDRSHKRKYEEDGTTKFLIRFSVRSSTEFDEDELFLIHERIERIERTLSTGQVDRNCPLSDECLYEDVNAWLSKLSNPSTPSDRVECEGVEPPSEPSEEELSVDPDPEPEQRRRMSVSEANAGAMRQAKKFGKAFFEMSLRQQAELIGCHYRTLKATDFYKRSVEKGLIGPTQPKGPRVRSLTNKLQATLGEGEIDEVEKQVAERELRRLTAEQDGELSPIEDDPPGHERKVHVHKRL